MRGIIASITVLLLPVLLWGQPNWELGITGGGFMYQGDVAPSNLPVLRETRPGYGALLRRHIGSSFALRGSFLSGRLSGNDANITDRQIRKVRHIRFESRIMEAGLMLEWEPFGAARYPGVLQFRRIISPYIYAGPAWYKNEVTADYTSMPRDGMWGAVRQDQVSEFPNNGFTAAFGGGLHIDLTPRSMVSIEVGARPAFNDYIDRVSYAGNTNRNDWYGYAGLNYNYRFALKDRDRDQIPDRYDLCPAVPGVISAMGCPDADGDGLEDLEDMCPNAAGPRSANGCPDADGDTIPDHLDDCPQAAGPEHTKGCPDTDEDGIPDKDDECPLQAGTAEYRGCPDTDGDGIPDPHDECPEEAGVPEKQGCPYRDSDGDGIFDDFDDCPDVPGPAALKGCPDTDGDGIADKDDRCPDMAGAPELKGCPVITEEKMKLLTAARIGIEFETGSAQLKPQSGKILDDIAEILKEYPAYHLMISGHTDNRGDAAKNLNLSKQRAKTCRDYLVAKDVLESRLSSQGFGQTKPIANNKTADGRKRNRRVEFDLVVPEE